MIGCSNTDTDSSQSEGADEPVLQVPGPWTDYSYVPSCSANRAPGEGGADALCGQATMTCGEGEIRFTVYSREMGADNQPIGDGDWEPTGNTVCRGADEPAEGGPPVITTVMIRDAARESAPTPTVESEPGDASFVNVPTNFYTESEGETVDVVVLGITIAVTFTPTEAAWAFGDGGVGSGDGIRGADIGAPGAVEHEYTRQGDYQVTVTQSYDVTATLPNGEVLTLDEPLTGTSEPYALDVGEIQSVVTKVR